MKEELEVRYRAAASEWPLLAARSATETFVRLGKACPWRQHLVGGPAQGVQRH